MNTDTGIDTNPNIKLYRLDDSVKDEIFKALMFYSKFDVARNLMLLDRANTCLTNVYDTVNADTASSGPIAAPTTVTSGVSDVMYKQNVNNTLNAFDGFLQSLAHKDPGNTILKTILLNFQKMVKDSLDVK